MNLTIKWTTEFTVQFVPVPPEKEEAYWWAIHYFAEILREVIESEMKEAEVPETIDELIKAPSSPTEG